MHVFSSKYINLILVFQHCFSCLSQFDQIRLNSELIVVEETWGCYFDRNLPYLTKMILNTILVYYCRLYHRVGEVLEFDRYK